MAAVERFKQLFLTGQKLTQANMHALIDGLGATLSISAGMKIIYTKMLLLDNSKLEVIR